MSDFSQQLRQEQALVNSVTSRKQFCSKRAACHMSLILTRPVQHMDYCLLSGGHKRLSRVSRCPKIQRSTQAMSLLCFLLEGCVRDNTEMGFPGRKLLVRELLWISLHPAEQLVEPPNMLHLRVMVLPLEGHNEHHNIYSRVRGIRNCSQKGDEELMQRWHALFLILSCG